MLLQRAETRRGGAQVCRAVRDTVSAGPSHFRGTEMIDCGVGHAKPPFCWLIRISSRVLILRGEKKPPHQIGVGSGLVSLGCFELTSMQSKSSSGGYNISEEIGRLR